MKNLLLISLLLFSATTIGTCSENNDISFPDTEQPESSDLPSGNSKTLVAYFSATGTTQAIAERITELTEADIYRINAADPYATNPYDDTERIQNEAYNDLRTFPTKRRLHNTTRYSSDRLAGGINRQWWSVHSSKIMI